MAASTTPPQSSGQFSATGVADSGSPEAKSLNRVWNIDAKWNLAERVIGLVTSQLPAFTHSITVGVQGGPDADIRRIYYLALSAAFGRYRNKVRGMTQSGQIQTTWDITGKACTVEIVYTTGRLEEATSDNPAVAAGVTAGIAAGLATGNPVAGILVGGAVYLGGTAAIQLSRGAIGKGPADPTKSPQDLFRRGPEQLTIGGNFGDLLDSTRFLGSPPVGATPTWLAFRECRYTALRSTVPLTTLRLQGPLREWPLGSNSEGKATQYPFTVTAIANTTGLSLAGAGMSVPGVNVGNTQGAFNLPDHGRIITTADKTTVTVQSPVPPVDGQTRGGMLALVSQALQRPCFLPASPPCTDRPLVGMGEWVTVPGQADDYASINSKVQSRRGTLSPSRTVPGQDSLGNKVDGYDAPASTAANFEHR